MPAPCKNQETLQLAFMEAAPNIATSPGTLESYRQIAKRVGCALDEIVGQANGNALRELDVGHVVTYVRRKLDRGGSKRTLQNELSRLRNLLRETGRADIADAEEITAKALGLSGASRAYHHTIISAPEYERVRVDLLEAGDPGSAAAMDLQRFLGVRPIQAVDMSYRKLRRYRRDLENGAWPVYLGQQREPAWSVAGALSDNPGSLLSEAHESIREAGSIIRNGDGALIHAARNDCRPLSGSEALTAYKHRLRRRGIAARSLRDSFAKQLLQELRAAGWSEADVVEGVWRALGGVCDTDRIRQARRLVRSLDGISVS